MHAWKWSILAAVPFLVEMGNSSLALHGSGAAGPVVLHVRSAESQRLRARVLDREDRTISPLQRVASDTFVWDGHDSAGRPVRPGTYILEVSEDAYSWSGAVTVVQ